MVAVWVGLFFQFKTFGEKQIASCNIVPYVTSVFISCDAQTLICSDYTGMDIIALY